MPKKKFNIALLCGGPSLERGISLNSARSVMDHLDLPEIELFPIYFDSKKRAYKISKSQLYSNTPSDFDFKLEQTALVLLEKDLIELLKSVDITFPIIHGAFGEDGEIQEFLEKNSIPFIGSSSFSCKNAFNKFTASAFIKEKGYFTLPIVEIHKEEKNAYKKIEEFFKQNNLKRAVVKPSHGGSSIGVFSISTPKEALEKMEYIFLKKMDRSIVIEEFAKGIEFTLIILENKNKIPVPLIPTEIETDYTKHQIFDFRKKYLPTRQVTWHCPPRFNKEVILKIQEDAKKIFSLFHMRDFGRFDGWLLSNGKIIFSDFNPISGMEQNSFLFQQGARVGFTHRDILLYILENACNRYHISLPKINKTFNKARKKVHVLMGGDTAERQVSLMSGSNVWLKLRKSSKYESKLFLLTPKKTIWELSYQLCLNHTVEEILENCENYKSSQKKLVSLEKTIRKKLFLKEKSNEFFAPKKLSLKAFMKKSPFVFIALHGGDGENGVFQELLEKNQIKYNGPCKSVSALCMDKWQTSRYIDSLNIKDLHAIPGELLLVKDLFGSKKSELQKIYLSSLKKLNAKSLIVKPRSDGCTTGILHLFSPNDFCKYIDFLKKEARFIDKNSFKGQLDIIEMPTKIPTHIILEKFIETDLLRVRDNKLKHIPITGLIEITVGVLEKNNKVFSFNPSITIAEGEVLSVEEKFQGGTGVNITPPPPSIMNEKILKKVKASIEKLSSKINIKGYSRIDAFVNIHSGELLIIEINTLPGLTPSTVFYHQGLVEKKALFPQELLETLIENKGY